MVDHHVRLCACGCGRATGLATHTRTRDGRMKGQPNRFISGHHRRRPLADRFWEKVNKAPGQGPHGDCWEFTGGKNLGGYGTIEVDRKPVHAHRVAYELTKGPIPPKHDVCHSCDNPPCVRDIHLSPKPHADNMADCRARGRSRNGYQRISDETRAAILAMAVEHPGLSQYVIAERLGLSQSAVNQTIRGKIRPRVAAPEPGTALPW